MSVWSQVEILTFVSAGLIVISDAIPVENISTHPESGSTESSALRAEPWETGALFITPHPPRPFKSFCFREADPGAQAHMGIQEDTDIRHLHSS